MRIGILSDTHNLLRPEVLPALEGCNHILHAGDIGNIAIFEALEQIAPTTAIRGNTDTTGPTAQLPPTDFIQLENHLFYLLHSLQDLDLDPHAAGIGCIITGHTHKPLIETRNGILYLNPGSCGPRRFHLPTTLAILETTPTTLTPTLIHLP